MPTTLTVDEAVERAVALAGSGRDGSGRDGSARDGSARDGSARDGSAGRHVLGIAGSPGSGKSTLARRVVATVTERLGPGVAVQVPMDGFHLANAALDALGRHDRKGAIDTFDADGYVALLRRLAEARDPITWAPDFDRRVDEPVAGSIAVPRSVRLVVTEGNYLLDASEPWNAAPCLLSESWFCSAAADVRIDRLVGRHMRHGRDFAAARAWAVDVDGANAARVEQTAERAAFSVST